MRTPQEVDRDAELLSLQALLKLADKLSRTLTSFRYIAGSAGLRDSYAGRDVIAAHEAYLAGKENDDGNV